MPRHEHPAELPEIYQLLTLAGIYFTIEPELSKTRYHSWLRRTAENSTNHSNLACVGSFIFGWICSAVSSPRCYSFNGLTIISDALINISSSHYRATSCLWITLRSHNNSKTLKSVLITGSHKELLHMIIRGNDSNSAWYLHMKTAWTTFRGLCVCSILLYISR